MCRLLMSSTVKKANYKSITEKKKKHVSSLPPISSTEHQKMKENDTVGKKKESEWYCSGVMALCHNAIYSWTNSPSPSIFLKYNLISLLVRFVMFRIILEISKTKGNWALVPKLSFDLFLIFFFEFSFFIN